MCGTLLEQGRGNDPTSPEGRRIADLVRTCNEVSSVHSMTALCQLLTATAGRAQARPAGTGQARPGWLATHAVTDGRRP